MKTYGFNIYVTEAERGAMPGMVMTYPMQMLLSEHYTGTLDRLANRVKEVKAEMIASRQFEPGKGFSVDARLCMGQRKPAGYDARRLDRCTNYIAA
jgi:hypothetical protein